MAELNVNIGNLQLKNPVMTASGTFGYGIEYSDFMDISRLGGIFCERNNDPATRREFVSPYGGNSFGNVECRRFAE